MRIIKPKHNLGDTRIIEKFAIFPITIYNETRWLERVKIEQKITPGYYARLPYPPIGLINEDYYHYLEWTNIRFVD